MNFILILQHVIFFCLCLVPSLAGILAAKYYYTGQRKMSVLFFTFGAALCIWLIFFGMYAVQKNWHVMRLLSIFFPTLLI